ncbi:MAG: PDZ domain-containing protein [Candidatus Sumerlaeia bacterium]
MNFRQLGFDRMRAMALLAAVALLPAVGHGQESTPAQTKSFRDQARYMISDLADQVVPSIVTIYVKEELTQQQKEQLKQFQRFFDRRGMDPFFRQFFDDQDEGDGNAPAPSPRIQLPERMRSGSGVILSEDGMIITNAHVIGTLGENTDVRVVLSDGQEISGKSVKLVASQDFLDLAIIKIDAGDAKVKLQPARWGDSDKLRIGEMVATIGSPLDLRMTVTQGIVCAKFRNIDDGYGLGDLIQTDAVINPGSSGGALVNMDGEVVGINRLITTNTGMWSGYGFAIPSNDAREFADKVIRTGRAVYGYVGIGMAGTIEADQRKALGLGAEQKGVLVDSVTPDSPAEKAGIKQYDFIVEADGKPLKGNDDLLRTVMRHEPGEEVQIKVLRGGGKGTPEVLSFSVKVMERPTLDELRKRMGQQPPSVKQAPEPEKRGQEMLGMTLEPYSRQNLEGLRVTEVKPNSPAAEKGMRTGDVITSIDRQPVTDVDEMADAIKGRPKDQPHLIQFTREGKELMAIIPQE